MEQEVIHHMLEKQREFFRSGVTLPPIYRIEHLRRLRETICANEGKITEALKSDLGKSGFESYMCEVGLVLEEIRYMLKYAYGLSKPRSVSTPLHQFAAKSYIQPEPYGNVLIMSPWNYPFLLTMGPLVDALAAGNTAVIKPSAYSPATSRVIQELVEACFDPAYVAVVTGGRAENQALLEEKFQYIFFTGSQSVGKVVMEKAAQHLTPVTLELGGKSPCIVDETADLKLAARRIVFGKFLNCGQTCVAPDYVWVHESVKEPLIRLIFEQIRVQYGEHPLENPNYGKIISARHFERLLSLIDPKKVVMGGTWDAQRLKIAPTVLDSVTWEDAVMGQEIFGPVLPIMTFTELEDVISQLQGKDTPLALYFFSRHRPSIESVTQRIPYGGGCINDTIIHLATTAMGFGGVGESGMGSYHGKTGFDTFSHMKSIVDKKTWIDLPMRYQPYKKTYEKLLRWFLH